MKDSLSAASFANLGLAAGSSQWDMHSLTARWMSVGQIRPVGMGRLQSLNAGSPPDTHQLQTAGQCECKGLVNWSANRWSNTCKCATATRMSQSPQERPPVSPSTTPTILFLWRHFLTSPCVGSGFSTRFLCVVWLPQVRLSTTQVWSHPKGFSTHVGSPAWRPELTHGQVRSLV